MVPVKKISTISGIAGEYLFISWHNYRQFVHFMAQLETICALHGTTGDALHLVEESGDIFTLLQKL